MSLKRLKKNYPYKNLNPRWSKGLRSIKLASNNIINPIFSKRSFKYSSIYRDWSLIVGSEFAKYTLPKSISSYGTLTVYVDPAFAIEFQHYSPIVLSKISEVFGINKIKKIKLFQIELAQNNRDNPQNKKKLERITLSYKESIHLDNVLVNTKNARLKSALKNLGSTIKNSNKNKA